MKQLITVTKAGFGAMLGIAVLAYGQTILTDWHLLIAPFGASAVLLFAVPESPLTRPMNVIGGHVLTSTIGLVFAGYVGVCPWSLALATGMAVSLMILTRTIHPPAGANPILVMLSRPGWDFLFSPVLIGAVLMVVVAKTYTRLCAARVTVTKS